ncbi:hypothetical protein ACTXT7_016325 [Hymenolepis weldensis]
MLRQVRQDHGAVARTERAKLSCPVTDCHKQFKVREVTNTVSGKREQFSPATTPLPLAGRVPKRASGTTDM